MSARDLLDRFHLWFMLVRSAWLVHVRDVLPRYDARTPEQAEVLRHWAGAVASRRAAETRGEVLDPEFLEIACLAAARAANTDDPYEWLDRFGRDPKARRSAEIAVGLNNFQAPQIVASFVAAAPPLRRSFERVAASVGLDTPSSSSSSRDILGFLAELVARFRPPEEAEYLAAYESLAPAEARELALEAIEIAEAGAPATLDDLPRDMLLRLGCLVPGSLDRLQTRIRPLSLGLPAFLMAPPGEPLGDWLKEADDDFEAVESGWDIDGTPRRLYHEPAYPLSPIPDGSAPGPLIVLDEHEGRCGSCGLRLSTLFDLDLTSERLRFLGVAGERLRIAVCEGCVEVGEGPTYSTVDGQGGSAWRRGPLPPVRGEGGAALDCDESDHLPRGRLTLGPLPRSPYRAVYGVRFNRNGNSQVGGLPTWVQDPDYPPCPGCRRPMTFVGQVDGTDLEYGDSILHAFLCAECGIAAAGGQQS